MEKKRVEKNKGFNPRHGWETGGVMDKREWVRILDVNVVRDDMLWGGGTIRSHPQVTPIQQGQK